MRLATCLSKTKLSCRDRPLTKADWLTLTNPPSLPFRRFAMRLEKSLEKLCTKIIGQKSPTSCASWRLGISDQGTVKPSESHVVPHRKFEKGGHNVPLNHTPGLLIKHSDKSIWPWCSVGRHLLYHLPYLLLCKQVLQDLQIPWIRALQRRVALERA
jgi:hypothetical protein